MNAAEGGPLNVLKWARQNGCPWSKKPFEEAQIGKFEMMEWYKAGALFLDGQIWFCYVAAKGGHLEVLKWLHENSCPLENGVQPGLVCSVAAVGGHLEVLKWAHKHGCEWNERTCTLAAYHGHLEVLKWAHANGCKWNEGTCSATAENGHLEVLKWFSENGCPWDENTCSFAALVVIWRL